MQTLSKSVSSRLSRLMVVVWGLGLVLPCTIGAGAEPVPVVVAVDTSRSLSAAELRSTTESVANILRGLADPAAVGVLAFDDSPRWVVAPEEAGADIEGALASLTPQGNYTVLNDALFSAARQLGDGGVILVLTDGRDENSATTVEDVADLCAANGVRVVALSTGRWVDEKALRRYALLSDGEFLGKFDETPPETVEATIDGLVRSLTEERRAAQAALAAIEPPVEAGQDAAGAATGSSTMTEQPALAVPWWLLPGFVLLLVAILVVLLLLWRLRRQPEPGHASEDAEWETDPALTPGFGADQPSGLFAELANVPPNAQQADELDLDPSAFERLPFDGDLDKTSVLDEQPVLTVMEPGKPLRTFRLSRDRAFAVGRAPKVNTLTLDDRTLSAQHFKIVPHDGGFVVVDLEATNGTLLNGRRVRARLLESGDTVRAGEVEFEFKTILKSIS